MGRLIRTIDLAGGGPATVAEAGDPLLGDWSPEGAILYTDVGRGAGLYRVPAAGGEAVCVSQPAPGVTHVWPSPIGRNRPPIGSSSGVRVFERLADGVAGGRELAADALLNLIYDVAPDGRHAQHRPRPRRLHLRRCSIRT